MPFAYRQQLYYPIKFNDTNNNSGTYLSLPYIKKYIKHKKKRINLLLQEQFWSDVLFILISNLFTHTHKSLLKPRKHSQNGVILCEIQNSDTRSHKKKNRSFMAHENGIIKAHAFSAEELYHGTKKLNCTNRNIVFFFTSLSVKSI